TPACLGLPSAPPGNSGTGGKREVHRTRRSTRCGAIVLGLVVVLTAIATMTELNADVPAVSDGSDAFGAPAASKTWYFAEGFTGTGFQEYLTLANPSTSTVTANITYVFNGGGGKTQ